ncbi:MFS transporter [Serratia marcescens]|uniref:MFS transporter n=1 Tax=Serratia TaxID=613 RepID=UPI00192CA92D|nr:MULTISPECIES: MFS transporter [Serratia]MBL5821333.1 MFS transporter [Serratia marcescens]HEJ9031747.1 MFS transporter [Serratia marcescens]
MMSMMKEKNLAISSMFFILGLCFGSLSSRMATIKGGLALSDGVFGTVLFAMSAGVVVSLPISGWAIAKLGSRVVGVAAILSNATLLLLVPFAATVPQLAALLFFSGFAYSAVNVSNNMQASIAEAVSGKTRLPFFHGIWGVAWFVGAGIGALMIGRDVALPLHFAGIAAVALMSVLLCRRALFDKPELEQTGRVFAIPDRSLFNYGLIVFCSMACEGIMYDWSVVYFQDVVSVDRKYIGLGFTVFMAAMTIGRLMLNRFVDRSEKNVAVGRDAGVHRHDADDLVTGFSDVDNRFFSGRAWHLRHYSAGCGGGRKVFFHGAKRRHRGGADHRLSGYADRAAVNRVLIRNCRSALCLSGLRRVVARRHLPGRKNTAVILHKGDSSAGYPQIEVTVGKGRHLQAAVLRPHPSIWG